MSRVRRLSWDLPPHSHPVPGAGPCVSRERGHVPGQRQGVERGQVLEMGGEVTAA